MSEGFIARVNCDRCGDEIAADDDGQHNADSVVCGACCRELFKRARIEEQRRRMRDPSYTPTVAEALSDPAGFVEGMTETSALHKPDLGGEA